MKQLHAALTFLTIIPSWPLWSFRPLTRTGEFDEASLGRSMAYFPTVGLLLGGLLVGGWVVLSKVWPASVVDLLLVGLLVVVTGGLHLDGFADTVDSVASRKPREEALRIMREGRIGPMGAAAVALLLGLKYAALMALQPSITPVALLLMPMAGRWTMVPAAYGSRYARGAQPGLARPYLEQVALREVVVAGLTAAAALGWALGWKGLFIMGLLGVGAVLFCRACERRFGGMTGDTFGALNETAEVLFLLLMLIIKEGSL